VLKQAELGLAVADLIRKVSISEQTCYRWKKQYAGLESDQVREVKQISEENVRLKRLLAELSLDKAVLQDGGLGPQGRPLPRGQGEWPLDKRRQAPWARQHHHVQFRAADCRACPSRTRCTRARSKYQGRVLAVMPQSEHEALAAARTREDTAEGRRLYAQRNDVEGTLSQAVRAFGLRQARYRGLPKTSLQHVATAAALNLDRIAAWFAGRPLAPTRTSRFAALAA